MFKLIWPFLIILGMLFVLVFDVGNGLDSPGFWLIPIGVVGGLASIISKQKSQNKTQSRNNKPLIIIWLLAFFSIGGLYFGWFTEGFGAFIYFWPAIIFTLIGLALLTTRLVRN